MTDTTQTTVASAPTGQAGAAGTPPAATGDAGGTATQTAASTGSVLGGGAEAKPDGSDQGQSATENKTTPEAGAEIEVKLPDGTKIDDTMLAAFKSVAKDVKLDSEGASKLASWYIQQQSEIEKAQVSSWEKQSGDWEGELKTDKEFGGQKFSESVAAAQKAVLKFGGQELMSDLNKYGIGNLPSLARAFAKVGAAMAEDSATVKPVPGGQVGLSESERNRARYDKSR